MRQQTTKKRPVFRTLFVGYERRIPDRAAPDLDRPPDGGRETLREGVRDTLLRDAPLPRELPPPPLRAGDAEGRLTLPLREGGEYGRLTLPAEEYEDVRPTPPEEVYEGVRPVPLPREVPPPPLRVGEEVGRLL